MGITLLSIVFIFFPNTPSIFNKFSFVLVIYGGATYIRGKHQNQVLSKREELKTQIKDRHKGFHW